MISRDKYLAELVSLQGNGMIKVITGMRRCGKSYLLFEIFASHLEQQGVAPDHIVKVDLEDYKTSHCAIRTICMSMLKAGLLTMADTM